MLQLQHSKWLHIWCSAMSTHLKWGARNCRFSGASKVSYLLLLPLYAHSTLTASYSDTLSLFRYASMHWNITPVAAWQAQLPISCPFSSFPCDATSHFARITLKLMIMRMKANHANFQRTRAHKQLNITSTLLFISLFYILSVFACNEQSVR